MGKVNLKFIKRILIYGTGLMCLAFGVVFSVNSGLGVFLGVALSVIFLNRVEGVREGTVICALLAGKLMKLMQKILISFIMRICF